MSQKKVWGPRPEYQEWVDRAIKLFPTTLGHINSDRIFLCGFVARRNKFVAKISRNANPWAVLLPEYDYSVQFWDPRFGRMAEAEKVYVAVHELVHIPEFGHEQGHPSYRKLKDHDVEDFSWMLDVYGVHMEKVDRILRGEEYLVKKLGKNETDGIRRFPRLPTSKAK